MGVPSKTDINLVITIPVIAVVVKLIPCGSSQGSNVFRSKNIVSLTEFETKILFSVQCVKYIYFGLHVKKLCYQAELTFIFSTKISCTLYNVVLFYEFFFAFKFL